MNCRFSVHRSRSAIAVGLPGSASMSILLGAFIIHGMVPGPAMLTTDLPLTFSMIFYIAMPM